MMKQNFKPLKAFYFPHDLNFKTPAGTSRGIMHQRKTWLLTVFEEKDTGIKGVGECAPLPGLSFEDPVDVEVVLRKVCENINDYTDLDHPDLQKFPSVKFALEMALIDLSNGGKKILFPSRFTEGLEGILTNGLIWMGDVEAMKKQVKEKIDKGFTCLKVKIGALDFKTEIDFLKYIRTHFSATSIELRVDANGAFKPEEAMKKLEALAKFNLHSIEQPIQRGQLKQLAALCKSSPVPIALDEELIGIKSYDEKRKLLDEVEPQFLVLKPTMNGGFKESHEWIKLADEFTIGWWITSALESNIGLNAIAQWSFEHFNSWHQGLGTGTLFTNNYDCPLYLEGEQLFFNPKAKWNLPELLQ